MDATSKKIAQWIADGKDPRSAHWQGGLEDILRVLAGHQEIGRLVPVALPDDEALSLFKACLSTVDLSPDLAAFFIPAPLADRIVPPESAAELKRIDPSKQAVKVLVAQNVETPRILCAEVSKMAEKPGFDIFQEGALLGSFNFDTHEDCIDGFTKALRAHLWSKDKWQTADIRRYTANWFEKVIDLEDAGVAVDADHSFFHSPTLVRSNRVTVLFELVLDALQGRLEHGQVIDNGDAALSHARAESAVLALLKLVEGGKLVEFEQFSGKEKEQFKNGFSATVKQLAKIS